MVYFYARVSSKEQNLARQMEVSNQYKEPDRIFCDKQSGKTFKRHAYEEMFSLLQPGDEVIVKELDRLGRDKVAVKDEIQKMKDMGVTLRILDVPTTLLDFGEQTWIQDMVNTILIEVMASIAEQERLKTAVRRDEGIAAMPVVNGKKMSTKTGKYTGRPNKDVDISTLLPLQQTGEMTVEQICTELHISKSTWYNRVRELKCDCA